MLSLSMDVSMVTFANTTHTWSKGVIRRYDIDEGEVSQCPCHSLLTLPP
jgi:hypothetical protein